MRRIGNNFYIQRGESFTLDFDVVNKNGDPLMLAKGLKNPYLVISITSALYTQRGITRENHWLGLGSITYQNGNGNIVNGHMKTFISTEALPLRDIDNNGYLDANDAIAIYGKNAGGKIVLNKNSEFDITNFLFVTENTDGQRVYKYLTGYTAVGNKIVEQSWEEYAFRIITSFDTKGWIEQDYTMDIKLLCGESLQEFVDKVLRGEGNTTSDELSTLDLQSLINKIVKQEDRELAQQILDANMPLMPNYDMRTTVQENMHIYVGVDTLGGR
jgi:hypothetical protein